MPFCTTEMAMIPVRSRSGAMPAALRRTHERPAAPCACAGPCTCVKRVGVHGEEGGEGGGARTRRG